MKNEILLAAIACSLAASSLAMAQVTTDKNGTLSADRPLLECPVQQTPVKNGASPNAELLKKIVRCNKGEKPASKGYDGAVTVDVAAAQIGTPRRWSYSQDLGNGQVGTIVYPVKVTYTVNTFYRTGTEQSANWIRILNFYVNAFGEWQIGSEESVKSPDTIKRIPSGNAPEAAGQATTGANPLHGDWVYASGESEGHTTAVYGDLRFTNDVRGTGLSFVLTKKE